MTAKLDKTIKRELELDGKLYTIAIAPDGIKVTEKGRRNGQEMSWRSLISGDASLNQDLKISVDATAAQPDGRAHGNGHVNEQPKAYWIAKFITRGFLHDDAAADEIASRLRNAGADHYMHENMMVFVRSPA